MNKVEWYWGQLVGDKFVVTDKITCEKGDMSDDFEKQAKINIHFHMASSKNDDCYESLDEFAVDAEAGRLRAEALLWEMIKVKDGRGMIFGAEQVRSAIDRAAELLSPKEGK